MDGIYTDLDNFNDVNLVEELKSENKELKFKLEEYSSAVHRLQKDFDKLSGEFKHLEKNYSSLLKTARAEIERKTETIKNLNIEKDQLVINSLQKGKKILQNRRTYPKDVQQNKNFEFKRDKESMEKLLQAKRHVSADNLSNLPTDSQSTPSENVPSKVFNKNRFPSEGNTDKDRKHKTNKKENIHETQPVKKIYDRRKSTNLIEPTFSSDEDSRNTISEQHYNQYPPKDVRQNENHYDQPSSYRNRGSIHEFDRQRNYDHYDSYDKSRRYYSPDNNYRYGKDQLENYHQRDYRENIRDTRSDKSPATDRYSRAKSRDRRNYERDNYYDQGRNPHCSIDHLPMKTRAPMEFEEPNIKRVKIDSYRHTNENNLEKEREFVERIKYANTQDLKEPSSCQSPDYTHTDLNVHHSIKEIIHTALTPLQDPRLLSNKYILKSNSEKPILMTVAGSNVDIVPITNPAWVEEKNTKPSRHEGVNLQLDMDIHNLSMESGEILSIIEDQPVKTVPSITELKSEKAKNSNSIVDTNTQTTAKEGGKSYKIPRIKKSGELKNANILPEQRDESRKVEEFGKDFRVIVEGKHLSEKSPENLRNTNIKTTSTKTRKRSKSMLQKLIVETELSDSFDNTKIPETCEVVTISTVEGDLELSDETSDNMDLMEVDTSKKETNQESTDDLNKNQIKLNPEQDDANKSDKKVKRSRDSRKSTHSRKDSVKEKTRENAKKRRKKKLNDQEECNVLKDESPPTEENIEKESKPNISSQTKTKFTDLFGDSNSLITPDDLGLPAASLIRSDKFVSIFENTQDAVDLSVEEISIVKASKGIEHTKSDEIGKEKMIEDTAAVDNESGNCDDKERDDNKLATINDDDNKSESDKNQPSQIFENAKSDDTSNIVKTVIISSGTQAQCVLQDKDVPLVENIVQKQSDLQKPVSTITAIATSTPYKLDSTQESLAMDPTLVSKDSTNDDIGLNTTESKIQNDSDLPDIRIVVKRRRKIAKRPA